MISHFQRLVGDCRADAGWIVSRYGWVQTRTLTGRERRAEGESLNVLGWVSPIACGLRVVGVVQAQGNVPTVTFLLKYSCPIYRRSHQDRHPPPLKSPSVLDICLKRAR